MCEAITPRGIRIGAPLGRGRVHAYRILMTAFLLRQENTRRMKNAEYQKSSADDEGQNAMSMREIEKVGGR